MTSSEDSYGELAQTFAEIAGTLFSASTVRTTLQRIVDCAVPTVEGCDAAGISLLTGTEITTPVFSDPIALEVDSVQYETGEGPCLDAIWQATTVYAEDLADDQRWPRFGPRAARLGMRSLLSFRLFANGTLGGLNLYARLPRAYGAADRTKALIFAAHAGMALAAAEAREDVANALETELKRVDNLRGALASRELIGQAEGILIERERITADQAFGMLRRASQHLNVKLREVAQHIVDTGDVPSG
ncbi:MAG TPA: GAF and ANTAR domain-containing protein [Acidimicrobiales bacterium]|nr:GAF and ANTAR domain-containing protein [Acidimicrobiales bacterium]